MIGELLGPTGEIEQSYWNTPPTLFQSAGQLASVTEVERLPGLVELARQPFVKPSQLKTWLTLCATWQQPAPGQAGGGAAPGGAQPMMRPVEPPKGLCEDLYNLNEWPVTTFPPLRGVSRAPAVRADGSIVTESGYDPATSVYFRLAGGQVVPPVMEEHWDSHVAKAKEIVLDDLLEGFDFAGEPDRANAVGALLTGLLRWDYFTTTTLPMHVLDATMQQSGKGTLAGVIARVWGGAGATESLPDAEDALAKKVMATLLADEPVITWDNVEHTIDSATLANLFTAPNRQYTDRILGISQMAYVTNDRLWLVTGNNVKLGKDLPRRSVWIRQEPDVDPRAGTRTFKHSDLLGWVDSELPKVWWALLTLIRAWTLAGSPLAQSEVCGKTANYKNWSLVIGGILETVGIGGFLENREQLMHDDEASEELATIVDAIAKACPGEMHFTPRTIADRINTDPYLIEALPSGIAAIYRKGGGVTKSLGHYLWNHRGQRCGMGDLRWEYVGMDGRQKVYKVVGSPVGSVYKGNGLAVLSGAMSH